MGLHFPAYQQYIRWIGACLKGDPGISLMTKNPDSYDIAHKMPATMQLVGMVLLWTVIAFIPISAIAAVRKNSLFNHLVRGVTILGISIPSFWLGFVFLLVFAVTFPERYTFFQHLGYMLAGSAVVESVFSLAVYWSLPLFLYFAACLQMESIWCLSARVRKKLRSASDTLEYIKTVRTQDIV